MGRLPLPTGAYNIGRVSFSFEDQTRIEPLDPGRSARRIAVDVWYPAERGASGSRPARYLDVAAFERVIGAEGLKKQLGEASDRVAAGVATHATEDAPFASSLGLAPVLLFSPGGGMIRELYTAQMEELASHGYIVAAMTHSYDGFLSIFPDGSSIAYDSRRWPAIPSFEGVADLNQLEWHTDDILVVLNELTRLNAAPQAAAPFAGHLDLARVGAFGHSFGGVAAAHACQRDNRIRACLNEDGSVAMKPFYLDARGWGMDQPFLLLERPPNTAPLTDADLAQMHVTLERAKEVVARLNEDRDRALRSTGTGSYRVLLRRDDTTHMDFSDLRVLSAKDDEELEQRMHVLAAIRSYTLAFFDRYLRGAEAPLLDSAKTDPLIQAVMKFAPGKRPE
ncbi:MAG TPA: hypothetical protein VHC90_05400 [Bryobacteraceae bacterium]|nr:hypothetical protein [Bryobacteraceae bacterium]